MNELADPKEERLYQRVTGILGDAHGRVARTVNTEMVNAYWRIGREIVEVEQSGKDRANYGAAVMSRLATRLRLSGVKGLSHTNLKLMRKFFVSFPHGSRALKLLNLQDNKGQTVPDLSEPARFHPSLGWTHYCALMRVENLDARSFYEIEAARESWSVRQLERQIEAMLSACSTTPTSTGATGRSTAPRPPAPSAPLTPMECWTHSAGDHATP